MKKLIIFIIALIFISCENNTTDLRGEENELCNSNGSCNHSFLLCSEAGYCESLYEEKFWGESSEDYMVFDMRTRMMWTYPYDLETGKNITVTNPDEAVELCEKSMSDGFSNFHLPSKYDFQLIFESSLDNPRTGHPLINSGEFCVLDEEGIVFLNTKDWSYKNIEGNECMIVCVSVYMGVF